NYNDNFSEIYAKENNDDEINVPKEIKVGDITFTRDYHENLIAREQPFLKFKYINGKLFYAPKKLTEEEKIFIKRLDAKSAELPENIRVNVTHSENSINLQFYIEGNHFNLQIIKRIYKSPSEI